MKYVYLDNKVAEGEDNKEDINNRRTIANQAFAILNNIYKKKKKLSIRVKFNILKGTLLSALLHASDCWKTTKMN